MAQAIAHYVPGEVDQAPPPAARLWSPIPPGVTTAYVEAFTDPGDAVLLPYCQGAAEVREVLAAGRRALAATYDPLAILTAGAALWPPMPRELDAAVARLGDSQKHGVPLREALVDLWASSCPACGRPAAADHLVWERDAGRPVARWVHCAECGWDGQSGLDADDEERMKAVPERGLHYYYLLERVAPEEEPGLRTRMDSLLKLYTPRSLYALAEVTMRIDALAPGAARRALRVLLLECLDSCSSLAPVPGSEPLRPGWSRPARYLERNVWLAFEEAAARRRTPAGAPAPLLAGSISEYYQAVEAAPGADSGAHTSDGPLRERDRAPGTQAPPEGFFCQAALREVRRGVPGRSVRLILASPPPFEPALWPLAALWGGWLLGAAAAEPLRALLRQRPPDIAWYAETMSRSLAALDDLLCDGGRTVLVLSGRRPAAAEAIALAAARAGLGFCAIHACGDGYRLELAPGLSRPIPAHDGAAVAPAARFGPSEGGEAGRPAVSSFSEMEQGLEQAVRVAASASIRARAEPVPWSALHAAILRALAGEGWLSAADAALVNVPSTLSLLAARARAALEEPQFVRMPAPGVEGDLWWLAGASGLGAALADRAEEAASQILAEGGLQAPGAFAERLCRELPGDLTPEPELIAACLHTYGVETPSGRWQLRAEDRRDARIAERASIVAGLEGLGRRLGYRASIRPPFDVAWYRAGQVHAVFAVRWQALLGALLPLAESVPGVQPFLVIPGGRSALLSLKLARNPLWQRLVDDAHWGFVKYRHVRDLLAQPDADEYTLRTIVGLDPIVEKEAVQLALF